MELEAELIQIPVQYKNAVPLLSQWGCRMQCSRGMLVPLLSQWGCRREQGAGETGHAGPGGRAASLFFLGHELWAFLVSSCDLLLSPSKPWVCNKLPRLLCLLGKEF